MAFANSRLVLKCFATTASTVLVTEGDSMRRPYTAGLRLVNYRFGAGASGAAENKLMVNNMRPVAPNPRDYDTFASWLAAATSRHREKANLARAIGVNSQDVNGWINDGKRPAELRLGAIAEYFGVPYQYLLAFWDPNVRESSPLYAVGSPAEPRPVQSVPLRGAISPISGGIWMETKTAVGLPIGGRVRWGEDNPALYAYQVLGDELFPRIQAGEFIIVDPTRPCEPGEEILVRTHDDRFAVVLFVSRRGNMLSCRQLGIDQRPLTIADGDVASMAVITAIVKQPHWMAPDP